MQKKILGAVVAGLIIAGCSQMSAPPPVALNSDAMGETLAIGGGAEPLATAAAALKDFEHILQARGHSPLLY